MERTICQGCGREAATLPVTLYKQTGMLIMRQTMKRSGNFCKECIGSTAMSYTGWNLVLGWWGVISCLSNPFYIANNLFAYGKSRSLPAP